MFSEEYPIYNSQKKLLVQIKEPEKDRRDVKTSWSLECDDFRKEGCTYGVDTLQSLFLCLIHISREIQLWEKQTNLQCEYSFFQGFEINHSHNFSNKK
jgi:hypothetical protein